MKFIAILRGQRCSRKDTRRLYNEIFMHVCNRLVQDCPLAADLGLIQLVVDLSAVHENNINFDKSSGLERMYMHITTCANKQLKT